MKTMRVMMGLLLAGVLVMVCGCGTPLENFLVKKKPVVVRPAQTNQVDVVSTNLASVVESKVETVVVKPAYQKADGTFVPAVIDTRIVNTTNFIPTLVTQRMEVVTPAVTYDERTINPAVIQGGERIASLTGVPWLDTGVTVAGALGAAVMTFFNNRNKKRAIAEAEGRKAAEGALETAETVGVTVVQSFEELRRAALKIPAYAEKDSEVMRLIQKLQDAAGVRPEIANIVNEETDTTKTN